MDRIVNFYAFQRNIPILHPTKKAQFDRGKHNSLVKIESYEIADIYKDFIDKTSCRIIFLLILYIDIHMH